MQPIPSAVKGAGAPPRIAFRFRALPCETTSSRAISQSAKILHAVLLDAGRRKGACTYTNRTLGGMIGRSPATVKRLLAELEAAGLARRELAAGGRIRSGVVPIAPEARLSNLGQTGVAHSQATERMGVAHSQSEGGSSPAVGVAHSRSASIQSVPQSEKPDGPGSPLSGREAADYLRRCVEAARRGEPMPPPPDFANCESAPPMGIATGNTAPPKGPYETPPPSPKGSNGIGTPAPTPTPRPGASLAEIGRMVAAMGERLKADDVGRRRVGPAKLARQLGEMRRRHGRRE